MKNKKTDKPLISVIMPVFNAEKYVKEAIQSIINQTYSNWKLIIVDDASSDASYKIIEKIAKKDARIILLQNKKNLGIALTVNKALKNAHGKYLARMDADDIALPERFERQVEYLENNQDIGILGSFMLEINEKGKVSSSRKVPLSHDEIVKNMFTSQSVQNPTLMLKKSLIPKNQLWYDKIYSPVDDLDFFFRQFKYVKFANIPEYLMLYRKHNQNSSLMNIKKTFSLTWQVRMKALYLYGYKPNLKSFLTHFLQGLIIFFCSNDTLYRIYKFWKKNNITNLSAPLLMSRQKKDLELSLIVPIYKAETFIKENILRLLKLLNKECSRYELIAIVDGFVDNTFTILKQLQKRYKNLKVYGYEKNRGKGYAVKYGLMKAKYKYAGYIDAGSDIDHYSLKYMLNQIKTNPDIDAFIADKKHPLSFTYKISFLRKIYSFIFNKLINIFLFRKFTDTQAGLKIFRKVVIQNIIYHLAVDIRGFAFDIEIMKELADYGYEIQKCPIIITKEVRNSTVSIQAIFKMIVDVFKLALHYQFVNFKIFFNKFESAKKLKTHTSF